MRRWLIVLLVMVALVALAGCAAGQTTAPGVQQSGSNAVSAEDPAQQTASGAETPETPGAEVEIPASSEASAEESRQEEETTMAHNQFYITASGTTFTAVFADNSSAQALEELLEQGDLTIAMSDYGGFEKVGSLGSQLPQNNEQITTGPGDVILYQGNSITIYYDTNSWNFTRLGKIEDVTKEELLAALGAGDVEVTFSLKAPEQ